MGVLTACLGLALFAGCGHSSAPAAIEPNPGSPGWDTSCDLVSYPSASWLNCETQNFALTLQAPEEQLNSAFIAAAARQSSLNVEAWAARDAADTSWLDPRSGNAPVLPLCSNGATICVGDPFRSPQATGLDGDVFYTSEASVVPVVFYDRDCARISGHIWVPRERAGPFPGVIITNGSFQAPETWYWWAAQALVRAGYEVMTYDPRGQGLSDQQAPNLEQGGNLNPRVFWEGQVDAIDFIQSSPATPYPRNQQCAGTYPTPVLPYNPLWKQLDGQRLGIAGHSLGAIGASVVQGYGAPAADPWPGKVSGSNPVKVVVGWDSLITPSGEGFSPITNYPAPPELLAAVVKIGTLGELPRFEPRIPALSMHADYGLLPVPYAAPPDPGNDQITVEAWRASQLPVMSLVMRGSTHLDFSLAPGLPATSWCPHPEQGLCEGGWASPAIVHYSVAWFDRWLKKPGEPGYDDADSRLLDDVGEQGANKLSFRYHSSRDFPDRGGIWHHCENIRAGCT